MKIKTYTFITGDLTDKTTWFSDAGTRTLQALTGNLLGLVWTSPDTNWIEIARVAMRNDLGTAYDVKVYVDGALQTSGYTVNYAAGTVTFSNSQAGSTVTATYKYAQTSNHLLTPPAGKYWLLPNASAQFSQGANFASGFDFKAWINNQYSQNVDFCVGTVGYRHPADLLGRVSKIESCPPFGGCLSNLIKLTWNFDNSTDKDFSYKLFPVGTVVDPEMRQFNKLSIKMVNDEVVTSSDFCTATFSFLEDVFG